MEKVEMASMYGKFGTNTNESVDNEEQLIKCKIQLAKVFHPKGKTSIKSGEYGIFVASIQDRIANCERLAKTIKLKGVVSCGAEYNEDYNVTCKLVDRHEIYGDTYEIVYINRIIELKDKHKQKNFLMSVLNETTVNRLFDKFDDVISVLESKDVKSLSSIKGVGAKSALRLINKYEESKDYAEVYAELGQYGLSSHLIQKLVEYYKSPNIVVEQVKGNPYDLVNVDGIGFKKADEIAEKVGIFGSNPNRVKGFIIHYLGICGESGKSYVHFTELMNEIFQNLGNIEEAIINSVASDLIQDGEVHLSDDFEQVGLNKYYQLEKSIAYELKRLTEAKCRFKVENIENSILISESEQGFEFTDEQKEPIIHINESNIIPLTGGGGVGKSSTAKGLSDTIKRLSVRGCALSGKASLRILEATNVESSTIHRLLGNEHGGWIYKESNQLEIDGLIIDESTMIDGRLFLSLLKAIPDGSKLFILGDVQQLTPIGCCQVFSDILKCSKIKSYILSKPHRQAMRSGIIPTSMNVINGVQIFDSSFEGSNILGELQDMELDIFKEDLAPSDRVVRHFLNQLELCDNDLLETQVVVAMKTRGDLSCYNINLKIQDKINQIHANKKNVIVSIDKERFYTMQIGDKVINTKNNYSVYNLDGDELSVFNGSMGVIKDIDDGDLIIDFVGVGEVIFDGKASKNLELAYACTCHKLQGSGFKRVICALDSSAYKLLYAEMLYTMLTRAKLYCVLVGKNQAIRTAINTRETKKKQTYLKSILDEIIE